MPALDASAEPLAWRWPVDLSRYDRSTSLQVAEAERIREPLQRFARGANTWTGGGRESLTRLLRPMEDTLDVTGAQAWTRRGVIPLLLRQMDQQATTFWAWDHRDWCSILGPDSRTFMQHYKYDDGHQANIVALAYLLCGFSDHQAIARHIPRSLAVKVFGDDHVKLAVDRVCRELFSWGSGTSLGKREIPSVVCTTLLHNRSPVLEDLTLDALAQTRAQVGSRALGVVAVHVSRALASLGCIEDRLTFERKPRPDLDYGTRTRGVPDDRLRWCERWRDTSTSHREHVTKTSHVC